MGAAALRDAPLLPLADGTLGSFRFGDGCRDPLETNVVFVPSDESEANVLTEMGRRKTDKAALSKLVDRSVFVENDASPLYDRILAFAKGAIGAASNVKPIDAGGLASLLPDLLPDAWGSPSPTSDSEDAASSASARRWRGSRSPTEPPRSPKKKISKKNISTTRRMTRSRRCGVCSSRSPRTRSRRSRGGLCSRWTKANDWRRSRARRARAGRGVVGARGVGGSRAGRVAAARVRGDIRGGDAHVHKPLRARRFRRGCAGLGRRGRRGDARSDARRARV